MATLYTTEALSPGVNEVPVLLRHSDGVCYQVTKTYAQNSHPTIAIGDFTPGEACNSCSGELTCEGLGQLSPVVTGPSTTTWGWFPAGTYRVVYAGGAMQYGNEPLGGYRVREESKPHFTVQFNGGEVEAPGSWDEYPTVAEVEAANAGDFVSFDHGGGDITLTFEDDPYEDNGGPGVRFELQICTPSEDEGPPSVFPGVPPLATTYTIDLLTIGESTSFNTTVDGATVPYEITWDGSAYARADAYQIDGNGYTFGGGVLELIDKSTITESAMWWHRSFSDLPDHFWAIAAEPHASGGTTAFGGKIYWVRTYENPVGLFLLWYADQAVKDELTTTPAAFVRLSQGSVSEPDDTPYPPASPADLTLPAWATTEVPFDLNKTILEQYEALQPGEWLNVPEGTWQMGSNSATAKKNQIAIKGAGSGLTVIECSTGGFRVADGSTRNDLWFGGFTLTCPPRTYGDSRFSMHEARNGGDAFNFRGAGSNWTFIDINLSRFKNGLVLDSVDGASNILISHCHSHHNYHVAWSYSGQGMYFWNLTQVVVQYCEMSYNGVSEIPGWTNGQTFNHGAYVKSNNEGVLFFRCHIHHNDADGIQLRSGGGTLIFNAVSRTGGIEGCIIEDQPTGIWTSRRSTVFRDNIVRRCGWGIHIGTQDGVTLMTLDNNVVYDADSSVRGPEGIASKGGGSVIEATDNLVETGSGGISWDGGDTVSVDTGNDDSADQATIDAVVAAIIAEHWT